MRSDNGPPTGWRKRSIGEVAAVRFSSVDKKAVAGEAPVRLCNYMEVWKNGYIHKDMPFMQATASTREIAQFRLKRHDVLLTKDSETKHEIAQASVVRDDLDHVVLGYHLALIRPKPREAYGPFVAAQLNEPQFRWQFVRVAGGATRYGLGLDAVKGGVLWLPEVAEQRQIAKALQAVDDAIEQTRCVIDQTRQLKTALFQGLLTHGLPGRHSEFKDVRGLGHTPASWRVTVLGSLTALVTSGSRGWSAYFQGVGAFFVRSQNVGLGQFRWDDVVCVKPPEDQEAERACILPDDLLVTVTGEPGHVARATDELGEAYVSQHVALVRLTDPSLARWAAVALCSPAGQAQFQALMYGQTRPGLNLDNIGEIRIPMPSPDEQRHICDMLDAVDNRIDQTADHFNQLRAAKVALSQALLTAESVREYLPKRRPRMSADEDKEATTGLGSLDVQLDAPLEAELLTTVRKLDPKVDGLSERDKAVTLAQMAIREWIDWINDKERHTRIDDMTTERIGDLYANIIEVVPSQNEIADLFQLKPNLARQVAQLFTHSPRRPFRRRVLVALRDALQSAAAAGDEPFTIQINKVLDQTLKSEEDKLFKADSTFEYRSGGKALFQGSSEVVVQYKHLESANKLIAHFDELIQQLDQPLAEPQPNAPAPEPLPLEPEEESQPDE